MLRGIWPEACNCQQSCSQNLYTLKKKKKKIQIGLVLGLHANFRIFYGHHIKRYILWKSYCHFCSISIQLLSHTEIQRVVVTLIHPKIVFIDATTMGASSYAFLKIKLHILLFAASG